LMTAILNNAHQSHTLASLRDALLPKLLSGEIRVKDTEKGGNDVYRSRHTF